MMSYEKPYATQAAGPSLAGQQAQQPPEDRLLEVLDKRFDHTQQQAYELGARIGSLADRLMGPRPKAVEDVPNSSTPQYSIGRLEYTASTLTALLNRAYDELQRLERL
jgi:hypothetical protein